GVPLPDAVRAMAQGGQDQWIDTVFNMAQAAGQVPSDIRLQDIKAIYRVAMNNQRLITETDLSVLFGTLQDQSNWPTIYHLAASEPGSVRTQAELMTSSVAWQ